MLARLNRQSDGEGRSRIAPGRIRSRVLLTIVVAACVLTGSASAQSETDQPTPWWDETQVAASSDWLALAACSYATPERGLDPRFGVIMAGHSLDADGVTCAQNALGAGTWYSFGGPVGVTTQELGIVRPSSNLTTAALAAQARPGRTWLLGNEPNVPGQDDISPSAFADFVRAVSTALLAADPSARLVGPNTLNWTRSCPPDNCGSYSAGRSWADTFVATYRDRYGALPFHAWGIHVYLIDWSTYPMVNAQDGIAQLTSLRSWLNEKDLNLPIWLTEFGTLWGYEGANWGSGRAVPVGSYRTDLLSEYLDRLLGWLVRNGAEYRVERWYLYATTPPPEPYTDVVGGITLLQSGSMALTPLGAKYRDWALNWEVLTRGDATRPTAVPTLSPAPTNAPTTAPTLVAPTVTTAPSMTPTPLPTMPAAVAILAPEGPITTPTRDPQPDGRPKLLAGLASWRLSELSSLPEEEVLRLFTDVLIAGQTTDPTQLAGAAAQLVFAGTPPERLPALNGVLVLAALQAAAEEDLPGVLAAIVGEAAWIAAPELRPAIAVAAIPAIAQHRPAELRAEILSRVTTAALLSSPGMAAEMASTMLAALPWDGLELPLSSAEAIIASALAAVPATEQASVAWALLETGQDALPEALRDTLIVHLGR